MASDAGKATATAIDAGDSAAGTQEDCFTCRRCRSVLFTSADLMCHEPGSGQEAFKWGRREKCQVDIACGSYFTDVLEWMEADNVEGKISCFKCGTKCGSFNWSGAQCSCGCWITPAIQFPKAKVDLKARIVDLGKVATPLYIAKPSVAES